MTIQTRRPSGKPPWPIMLLAGVEKSGKSYAAAAASASDAIDRTFWVSVGEDDPDEYGAIPGADFEIVEHDGTYRGILAAVEAAAAEPAADGKVNLIVLDSGGRLWALLNDDMQAIANDRARRRKKPVGDDGAQVTMDLWNLAKQRWNHVLDVLRDHSGPSIITARLDVVTVVDGRGEPTRDKTWKVQAEKNLPYEVGVAVHLRGYGDAWLTGVRSLRFRPTPAEFTQLPDFTVVGLWERLGMLEPDATAPRQHSGTVATAEDAVDPQEPQRPAQQERPAATRQQGPQQPESGTAPIADDQLAVVATSHAHAAQQSADVATLRSVWKLAAESGTLHLPVSIDGNERPLSAFIEARRAELAA